MDIDYYINLIDDYNDIINKNEYDRIIKKYFLILINNLDFFIEHILPRLKNELDEKKPINKNYDYYDLIEISVTNFISLKNGLLHKDNGPAIILKGFFYYEFRWYQNGLLYNENGPTRFIYKRNLDNNFEIEFFYNKNGVIDENYVKHYIKFNNNNKIIKKEEKWYKNGKIHNINGPAFFKWDDDGNLISKKWYINGEEQENPRFKRVKSARNK